MLKNKPTKKKTAERLNHEPQNQVTLRKVGAGKATGRACRLEPEPNGPESSSKGCQSAPVCLCVPGVCVSSSRAQEGTENKQENEYIRELGGFQETAGSEGFNIGMSISLDLEKEK